MPSSLNSRINLGEEGSLTSLVRVVATVTDVRFVVCLGLLGVCRVEDSSLDELTNDSEHESTDAFDFIALRETNRGVSLSREGASPVRGVATVADVRFVVCLGLIGIGLGLLAVF